MSAMGQARGFTVHQHLPAKLIFPKGESGRLDWVETGPYSSLHVQCLALDLALSKTLKNNLNT